MSGWPETAHHDVVGRPRSDPAQPQELLAGDGGIGADVQLDIAGEHCCGETSDRVAPGLWHGERLVGCGEELLRPREQPGDLIEGQVDGIDRGTDRLDDPARHGSGAGHRHLLADHRSHSCLERVDAGRRTSARNGRDECPHHRVAAERLVDGARVGIEVEQSADPLNGSGEVVPRRQCQPGGDMVVCRHEADHTRPTR